MTEKVTTGQNRIEVVVDGDLVVNLRDFFDPLIGKAVNVPVLKQLFKKSGHTITSMGALDLMKDAFDFYDLRRREGVLEVVGPFSGKAVTFQNISTGTFQEMKIDPLKADIFQASNPDWKRM